jgi:hypothetical protein
VWPHDSEDANLPVKSVLGGQIEFERDKVGDTDQLFYSFASLVYVSQLCLQFLGDSGNMRTIRKVLRCVCA